MVEGFGEASGFTFGVQSSECIGFTGRLGFRVLSLGFMGLIGFCRG